MQCRVLHLQKCLTVFSMLSVVIEVGSVAKVKVGRCVKRCRVNMPHASSVHIGK